MPDDTIFSKTSQGHDELKTRSRSLGPVARRLLLFVNGNRSRQDLAQLFSANVDLDAELAQLEGKALITRQAPASRPVAARVMPADPGATPQGLLGRWFRGKAAANALDPLEHERAREAGQLLYELLGPASDDLTMRLEECRDSGRLDTLLASAADLVEHVHGSASATLFRRATARRSD